MSDVFISYARSTEVQALKVAEALTALGYDVWRDDALPAHRPYAEVIEENLRAAKAVVVIWSADAAASAWVRSEADIARAEGKLVQLTVDGARLPMPFEQIQCAKLIDWTGDADAAAWRKVVSSVAELVGGGAVAVRGRDSGPALALPSKPSIAVLPFANLSADRDDDYFTDGMLVEIVTALSRFKSIFIIASSSSLSLKGAAANAQEAARTLGVRYVLEGSVRRAGGRVRITVQLIDATDGAQIWGDRFDDTLEDVFALQDRVAMSVAGVIEPTVQKAELRRASKRPTDKMGSYDLYLRALHLEKSVARDDVAAALDLLHRAIDIDPNFAPALALASWNHSWVYINGWSDDPEGDRRQAMDLAHAALRVGPDDADVLHYVAYALLILGERIENAAALIDQATALNPGHASAWMASGWIQAFAGHPEAALEHLETSMRLDPRSSDRGYQLHAMALAEFELRRFAEAVKLLRESDHLLPNFGANHAVLGACHAHLGELDEARREFALYRRFMAVPLPDLAHWTFRKREHFQLFMDGMNLAISDHPPSHPNETVQDRLRPTGTNPGG